MIRIVVVDFVNMKHIYTHKVEQPMSEMYTHTHVSAMSLRDARNPAAHFFYLLFAFLSFSMISL